MSSDLVSFAMKQEPLSVSHSIGFGRVLMRPKRFKLNDAGNHHKQFRRFKADGTERPRSQCGVSAEPSKKFLSAVWNEQKSSCYSHDWIGIRFKRIIGRPQGWKKWFHVAPLAWLASEAAND